MCKRKEENVHLLLWETTRLVHGLSSISCALSSKLLIQTIYDGFVFIQDDDQELHLQSSFI